MSTTWNLWHGCTKVSAGCKHCYVYRREAWSIMRTRADLDFFFVTKRPERFHVSLPDDWGDGYPNVHICCTCENQYMADKRLPIFLQLPIRHKSIIHEPMLGPIHIEPYLKQYGKDIVQVVRGGESGDDARLCDYAWVMDTMCQCVKYEVPFRFKQTGQTLSAAIASIASPERISTSRPPEPK